VECVRSFREEGLTPDLFWYNPNIHPFAEYRARRSCLSGFAFAEKLNLIEENEYGLRGFLSGLSPNFEGRSGGSRCAYCYRMRLAKTAALAATQGYEAFSSTLLISPYQNHELLRRIGEDAARAYGPAFLYRDFRPRFYDGQKQAREREFYMQKYCGCVFSEEERYIESVYNVDTL
jgi:predicted adenine nucleotide alpha hydrolase (AANH) superfamily ATPase